MMFFHSSLLCLVTVCISIAASYSVLKLICSSRQDFMRFLYISSEKSATNARLLGGFAISTSIILSVCSLLIFNQNSLTSSENKLLLASLFSTALVTLYGYIDDKYEIRVRFKLLMQFTSIFGFSYLFVQNTDQTNPLLTFALTSIFGIALVNGSNLLDGLDTLMVKLGGVTSLAFLYLGIISHSLPTIVMSVAVLSSLSVFYFFNREPARVYMGEIGGGMIGLVYFFQSTFAFSGLKTSMNAYQAFALVSIAGLFPVCELGISFARRLWGKKSPFRGDKLHLHYVLKNRYQLRAAVVSSRIGVAGFATLAAGFIMASVFSPMISFFLTAAFIVGAYTAVCFKEWHSSYHGETPENLLKLFEGKKVNIINSTGFGNIDVSLNSEQKSSQEKSSQEKKSA